MTGFLLNRRAAVGVSSVLIAMMCLAGTAMVADHVLLFHQRNVLRSAADAASLAATQEMATLDASLTDAQVATALDPLVRRYILANLPGAVRESAKDSLEVTLTPDRVAGVVGVAVDAELGGAMAGRHLWGPVVSKTRASSGAERVLAPVDLVLAIDVTGSMKNSIIHGRGWIGIPDAERRINVVRAAAQTLLTALYDQQGGATGHVSVGLVPYTTTVNIGATRQTWVSDLGQGHKVIPAGFGAWRGCVEHRTNTGDLDLSLDTPADEQFTSWFYPSSRDYRPAARAALAARVGGWLPGDNDWDAAHPHTSYFNSPHFGCPRNEIVPLTADKATVDQAIADLEPWNGGGTMTHVGMVWGRRLLASGWRGTWGLSDAEEPGKTKVLVLLTDGVNLAWDSSGTYPGRYRNRRRGVSIDAYTSEYTGYGRVGGTGTAAEGHRTGTRMDGVTTDGAARVILDNVFIEACTLAKNDGITVFTVSAVPSGHPDESALRTRLVSCASSEAHAFTRNSDQTAMTATFRQIGRIVAGIRRTGSI